MKIGLVGYFGNHNVGDEAILRAMISQLKKYHKKIIIAVFTDSPEVTKEKYNVIVFSRKKLTHLIAGVSYCDIIIFAGGSLFQDQTSLLNMFYYTGIAELSKFYKKKLIFYSQGFDHLKSFVSKRLVKRSIFLADKVSARDHRSIRYLKDTLKVKKQISFVMDTALLMLPYQSDNKYIGHVGINIMAGQVTKKLLNELIGFKKRSNAELIFVPFNPEDMLAYEAIKEKLKIKVLDESDPCKLMGFIKQMDSFIGQRYHSLVFSASARTPFVYLGKGDKGLGFSEMVKQGIFFVDDKELENKLVNFHSERIIHKNVLNSCMEKMEKESVPELICNVLVRYV